MIYLYKYQNTKKVFLVKINSKCIFTFSNKSLQFTVMFIILNKLYNINHTRRKIKFNNFVRNYNFSILKTPNLLNTMGTSDIAMVHVNKLPIVQARYDVTYTI